MKQSKLLKKLYRACVNHDEQKIIDLRKEEFQKILKRRAQGKPFTHKWTLVSV